MSDHAASEAGHTARETGSKKDTTGPAAPSQSWMQRLMSLHTMMIPANFGTYVELLLPVYLAPLAFGCKETKCVYCITVTLVFLVGDTLPPAVAGLMPIVLLPVAGIMSPNDLAVQYMNAEVLAVCFLFMIAIVGDETAVFERLCLKALASGALRCHRLLIYVQLGSLVLAAFVPAAIVAIFSTVFIERLVSFVEEEFTEIEHRTIRARRSRSSDAMLEEGGSLRRHKVTKFSPNVSLVGETIAETAPDQSDMTGSVSLVRQYKMHPDLYREAVIEKKDKSPRKTSFDPFERVSEGGVWTPYLPVRRIHSPNMEQEKRPAPILKTPSSSRPCSPEATSSTVLTPTDTTSPVSDNRGKSPSYNAPSAGAQPRQHESKLRTPDASTHSMRTSPDEASTSAKIYGTNSSSVRSALQPGSRWPDDKIYNLEALTPSSSDLTPYGQRTLRKKDPGPILISSASLATPEPRYDSKTSGLSYDLEKWAEQLFTAKVVKDFHRSDESSRGSDPESKSAAGASSETVGSSYSGQQTNGGEYAHLDLRQGVAILHRMRQAEAQTLKGTAGSVRHPRKATDAGDVRARRISGLTVRSSAASEEEGRQFPRSIMYQGRRRMYSTGTRRIYISSPPVRSLLSGGRTHFDCTTCISKDGYSEDQPTSAEAHKIIAAKQATNIGALAWIGVALPVVAVGLLSCWAYVYWCHLRQYTEDLDDHIHQQVSRCARARLRDGGDRRLEEIVIIYWMVWFPFSYIAYVVRNTDLEYVEGTLLSLMVVAMSTVPKKRWKLTSRHRMLSWDVIRTRMPWNVIVTLGAVTLLTKLAEEYNLVRKLFDRIGNQVWCRQSPFINQLVLTFVAAVLSEVITSRNLAELIVPIVMETAAMSKTYPVVFVVPVGLAACTNVIMPISLPLVILREYLHIPWIHMFIYGLLLKLLIVAVIVMSMDTIGMLVFSVDTLPEKLLLQPKQNFNRIGSPLLCLGAQRNSSQQ